MKIRIEAEDGDERMFDVVEFCINAGDTRAMVEHFWQACYPFVYGSSKVARTAVEILNGEVDLFDDDSYEFFVRMLDQRLKDAIIESGKGKQE